MWLLLHGLDLYIPVLVTVKQGAFLDTLQNHF